MKLKIENLHKSFKGANVLTNINLNLKDKNSIAIIGPSGGGKSTLLNILSGYIEADGGYVKINEHVLENNEKKLKEYRKSAGIVFQAYNLFPHMSALKNITLVLEKVHNYSKVNAKKKALSILESLQLKDHSHKKTSQLSGGQQQRVAIARALSYDPELLFFDEPTSALDPALTTEILETIKRLKDEGRNLVIVTHEMGFARQVADYVLFIDKGTIIESGEPDIFFNKPKTQELKTFLDKILEWKL